MIQTSNLADKAVTQNKVDWSFLFRDSGDLTPQDITTTEKTLKTITIPHDGTYFISAVIGGNSDGESASTGHCYIKKNGTRIVLSAVTSHHSYVQLNPTIVTKCSANDTITITMSKAEAGDNWGTSGAWRYDIFQIPG